MDLVDGRWHLYSRMGSYENIIHVDGLVWRCASAQKWENSFSWGNLLIFLKTLLWFALNCLHSALPKLLEYIRSWSNRIFFLPREQQTTWFWSPTAWLLGIRPGNRKNKGLLGMLKTSGPQQLIWVYSVKVVWNNTCQLQESLQQANMLFCNFKRIKPKQKSLQRKPCFFFPPQRWIAAPASIQTYITITSKFKLFIACFFPAKKKSTISHVKISLEILDHFVKLFKLNEIIRQCS